MRLGSKVYRALALVDQRGASRAVAANSGWSVSVAMAKIASSRQSSDESRSELDAVEKRNPPAAFANLETGSGAEIPIVPKGGYPQGLAPQMTIARETG